MTKLPKIELRLSPKPGTFTATAWFVSIVCSICKLTRPLRRLLLQ
jgi:hypothetical protein